MIDCKRMGVLLALLLAVGLIPLPVRAQQAKTLTPVPIGYLGLKHDPRYRATHQQARYLLEPIGRPLAGAETAIGEVKFMANVIGVDFKLVTAEAAGPDQLRSALDGLVKQGARFILLDLPAPDIARLAKAYRGKNVLLFNVSAHEDSLRGADCQPELVDTTPSYAMLSDALVQYLVFKKWRRVLILQGPSPSDAEFVAAFKHSAKRYGATIVATRKYILSNDPRQRNKNNVPLITGDADYDVVFVADADGEFARAVPYQTLKPQLVVGSAGLGPGAWQWSWDKYGAEQLNNRFRRVGHRDMTGIDWSAWIAVKSVAEAVLRTRSAVFKTLRDYILSSKLALDDFKGYSDNFRPWDHQLRQPVLLFTANWVVARAPLPGFLHQTNNLDTIGYDRRESQCHF